MSKTDIIYGLNPVVEAIKAGKEIEKIFLLKSMLPHKAAEIKKVAIEFKIPIQYVPKEKLNRFTRQNHQGIVAITSPVFYTNIETLLPTLFESGKAPFILILDKITDVRNLGAIARSAKCAGVDAIVIPAHGSAMINADAVKTSAGALNKIPVCRNSNLKETILYLKNSGLQIVAATEKAKNYYYDINYNKPLALILGSEEKGVSDEYLKLCDNTVKIPMIGEIQSLNVSVAGGIIMFEVVKQRMLITD
jgi:23S rRNA (guanosine2251-2'-O)-methyltransferase